MNKTREEKEKAFLKKVEVIKKIKAKFEDDNKKGAINYYFRKYGGEHEVIRSFGSLKGFLRALKEAGYDRKYIKYLEKRFKE